MKKRVISALLVLALMFSVFFVVEFESSWPIKVVKTDIRHMLAEIGGDNFVYEKVGDWSQVRFDIDGHHLVINSTVWEPSPMSGLFGNSCAYVAGEENIHLVPDMENPIIALDFVSRLWDRADMRRIRNEYGIERVYLDDDLKVVLNDRQVRVLEWLADGGEIPDEDAPTFVEYLYAKTD